MYEEEPGGDCGGTRSPGRELVASRATRRRALGRSSSGRRDQGGPRGTSGDRAREDQQAVHGWGGPSGKEDTHAHGGGDAQCARGSEPRLGAGREKRLEASPRTREEALTWREGGSGSCAE